MAFGVLWEYPDQTVHGFVQVLHVQVPFFKQIQHNVVGEVGEQKTP